MAARHAKCAEQAIGKKRATLTDKKNALHNKSCCSDMHMKACMCFELVESTALHCW